MSERNGPDAGPMYVSLSGHLVHEDGWCSRPACSQRHPYVVVGQA